MRQQTRRPVPIPERIAKKKNPRQYFDLEVQEAIVRYNALDPDKDSSKRDRIYTDEIHYAFDKLCENIINTFKFTYFDSQFEDVKNEVVAFLVMNMHKYDHSKGAKAFSYFSVVAKNYLILNNNNNYKKLKQHCDIDKLKTSPKNQYLDEMDSYEHGISLFIDELVLYLEDNINSMFKKKRDLDIAYAIIELLKRRDEIENFNKKSLYLLIREMTGVTTNNITKIMNVIRQHYSRLIREYDKHGTLLSSKFNKWI